MAVTRTLATLTLLLSYPAISAAQTGFRQITSTYPIAVQRGTEAELTVRSNYTLDGCYEAFMDVPGVTLEFAETEPKEAPRRGRGSIGTPFKFNVTVEPDAPLGMREIRFATPQAVSSCAMLMVTEFPVVLEADDNGAPDAAQSVNLPAAICGIIEKREEVDYYKFQAREGQTLVFEIFAQRATEKIHNLIAGGNYLMDAILTLYDPQGREVAQNDDYYGGDSLLAYTFPADGEYVLSVRDVRYNGHACYCYCVEISDRPFVQSVYPLAVRAGESAELRMTGYNLPESPLTTFVAEADQVGVQTVELAAGSQTTNPVSLLVSDLPQLLESEEAGELAEGTRIEFPVGLNGRLETPGDVDHYVFSAKKGDAFDFHVRARGLGSLADTVVAVRDVKGKRLAFNDDGQTGRKDSALTWTAPSDGDFVLEVADLSGKGGDGYPYHAEARRAEPDFEFGGHYYYAMLAPGNRMIWFVRVRRLHGFDGPIEFTVENLPEGVTAVPLTLPGHMNDGALILEASDDAQVNANLVRVKGTATTKGADGQPRTIERYGDVHNEIQSQGGGQGRWPISTQIVGVTEKMDLNKVTASPTELSLAPGDTATINVEIERHPDYAGKTVSLDTAFKYFNNVLGAQLPPGVTMSSKSVTRLTGDKTSGTIVLEVSKDAKPVERLPVAAIAGVSVTFSISTLYCSEPIYLTIAE